MEKKQKFVTPFSKLMSFTNYILKSLITSQKHSNLNLKVNELTTVRYYSYFLDSFKVFTNNCFGYNKFNAVKLNLAIQLIKIIIRT